MKDNSITLLRVFATICIVLLHCFCYTIGGWGFFGKTVNANMPQVYFYSSELGTLGLFGFTFISGLLFSKLYYGYNKYHDPIKTIKNKFYRLLIPYFFWGEWSKYPIISLIPQYFSL